MSAGDVRRAASFLDNPGDPENWSNSYTQYIAEAAWKSLPDPRRPADGIVASLARYAEGDVRASSRTTTADNNKLIEYDWGAMTGNDADAVSFHWKPGNMDRAESAYQYSGALAAAQRVRGDSATRPRPSEMRTTGEPDQGRHRQRPVEPRTASCSSTG
ncbi:hypothetical protein SPURM210S_07590 [Streptomyces purpurascens]